MFQHVPINSPSLVAYSEERQVKNLAIGAAACPIQDDSYERLMQVVDREDSPVRAMICGDAHRDFSGQLTDRIPLFISPIFRDFAPVLFTVKGE